MPSDRVERRLAAILAADVAGYSRLMGKDEERTVEALRGHRREVTDTKIVEHRGRIVNTAGDSILAEFSSVLDAVRCAVEVQQAMAARNVDVPEDQRIVFRIGINVGDVIFQGGEVYGDGVNIAARLEQIAELGAVFVSRTVREQVGNKLPYAFDDLGPRQVKNIAQPVEVWRVRWEGAADKALPPAQPQRPLAQKTVPADTRVGIAVLPFQNLSGDPEEDYFSDGLTEDLITDLAAFPQLRVIARNTMFTYKGKPVTVPQVVRELGVGHVVEGSVRKAGNRLRLTAQLIEAVGGSHVWAGRYDRELADVFAIQDEIVQAIVTELQVKLLEGEQARSWRKSTTNAQAYDYFLRAVEAGNQEGTHRNIELAVSYLKQALDLDPDFAVALAWLADLYRASVMFGFARDPQQTLSEAARCAQRAVELNPLIAAGQLELGLIAILRKEFDEGEALLRKAMALEPEGSDNLGLVALGLVQLGQHREAARVADQAMAVSPHHDPWIDDTKGLALFHLERFSEALQCFFAAQSGGYADYISHAYAAAAHSAMGQDEQARAEMVRVLESETGFGVETLLGCHVLRLAQDRDRLKRHLLRVGAPA